MHKTLEAILALDILVNPDEYLSRILSVICQDLDFTAGFVLEQHGDDPPRVLATYPSPELEAWARSLHPATWQRIWEHTVDVGSLHIEPHPTAHAAWAPFAEIMHTRGIRTAMRIPLMNRGHIFGCFELLDSRDRSYTEEEALVLGRIGEMAAIAIAGNRYLEQLNAKAQQLKDEILERRRVEQALREALRERKSLEEIVNRSPVVVFLWRADEGWPIEFVSRSIEQFGYTTDDLYTGSLSIFDLIHADDRETVRQEVMQHLANDTGEFIVEFRIVTKTGETRWVENRLFVRRDTDGFDLLRVVLPGIGDVTHLQGIMQDITERKLAVETIRHQAYHDTLTDLPNRALFHDRVSLALAHARRHKEQLAVMFLDLDRFKNINDTLGHSVGDQVLIEVARRLVGRLREEDTVSRLGGDEFTILLPAMRDVQDAALVGRKVLDAFIPPVVIDGHELHLSTSIGISLYPSDGQDVQTLLKNADTALYHAKEQGRNNLQFFTPAMNEKMIERMSMETSLRHALERRQFILHYQPQVATATGQVIGMESLIRWQHPDLGLVSPGKFIPLAEETGLIEPIGGWVLREACLQNKAWQRAGFPALKVAVNLSARQFYQENLVELVAEVLRETEMHPHALELEITESVAMRNVEFSIHVMRSLKEMGVRLSMDDFGVGYSSLIYLKKFPISTLKIDQSFVRGLTTDPNDKAIATAIIAMARSLGLTVIAEGVETEEQLALLRAFSCDGMQGFLFSRPLPAEAIGQLLRFLAI